MNTRAATGACPDGGLGGPRSEREQPPLHVVRGPGDGLLDSYRRLAEVFHDLLSEQSLESLLDRIADALGELIPHDSLTIYEADETARLLVPLVARDPWAEEILKSRPSFGEGITGWVVEHREPVLANEAHRDPRVKVVPGTPVDEPEALISLPLVARGSLKGALNVYRLGVGAAFGGDEFELAKRFGDAAALALDNAQTHARLEHLAQTDCLTGLYNHRFFHDRLRSELNRASRAGDAVSVLMLDIDDFKRVNDVHGHEAGDEVLQRVAVLLATSARDSDVVCRVGGEEFALVMPSCRAGDAVELAKRLADRFEHESFGAPGKVRTSIGIAEGPKHAGKPRELAAYAEAAMMTAKARGKNRIVLFDDDAKERPDASHSTARDVRAIAHLKMLQNVAGKLGRLTTVEDVARLVAGELRTLVDYDGCRLYLAEEGALVPVASVGEPPVDIHAFAAQAAAEIRAFLVPPWGAGSESGESAQSIVAVPLSLDGRTVGALVASKAGARRFDEDDLRLLEVLARHAAVAFDNARLYDGERREAEVANTLLELTRALAAARGEQEVAALVTAAAETLFGPARISLSLRVPDAPGERFHAVARLDLDGRLGSIALRCGGDGEAASPRDLRLLVRFADEAGPLIADALIRAEQQARAAA